MSLQLADLAGREVAILGFGREGRAALVALRHRAPGVQITVAVPAAEIEALSRQHPDCRWVDIDALQPELLAGQCRVIRSPGVSPYRPPLAAAIAAGAWVTTGTALWFAEGPHARVVCVTGSKGKSTTTALIAHLLRACGLRTALAGNIGMPLLELLEAPPAQAHALELSSFQAGDAMGPDVAVILNLFPEHLDWHGTFDRYVDDKLKLATVARPRRLVHDASNERLAAALEVRADQLQAHGTQLVPFGEHSGFHVGPGGILRGGTVLLSSDDVPLPGRHNLQNVCAALTAVAALDVDLPAPRVLREVIGAFQPLPHRFNRLGTKAGISFIDDSIATTPEAALAAIGDCLPNPVVPIIGGFDRGLDWQGFAAKLAATPLAGLVTFGTSGEAVRCALSQSPTPTPFPVHAAVGMAEAISAGKAMLKGGGVLLLSPAAPSFGMYRDYAARGRDFADLAGFPIHQDAIAGLGVL